MDVKKPEPLQGGRSYWVRITLTGPHPDPIRKVTDDLITRAKAQNLKVKGPKFMPTRTLRITTRKTPCGEGSKTWDRYQMRIHKRVIDLLSTGENVEKLTAIYLEPGVNAVIKKAGFE